MSLQGVKIVAKLIEQMESANDALQGLAIASPHSAKTRQDERFRSAVACKLAEFQDEVEPIIAGEDAVRPNRMAMVEGASDFRLDEGPAAAE